MLHSWTMVATIYSILCSPERHILGILALSASNKFSPLFRPHCEKQNNQVKALKLYCSRSAQLINREKVGEKLSSDTEQSAQRTAERVWYGMVWYGMVWYGMVWCLGIITEELTQTPGP
ncbi:hypothetical protein M5D96_002758, partial [Drosophila gunungcola]